MNESLRSIAKQVGVGQAGESRFFASWAGGRCDDLKAGARRAA